jgi:hypothetical protein|tara:strand:- start:18 stop:185 length:168 start_codon:yes stop_codon:yes gene_type:complete
MIKWIKKLLAKLCTAPEPIVEEIVEEQEEVEIVKCATHNRYKKSCPVCVASAQAN